MRTLQRILGFCLALLLGFGIATEAAAQACSSGAASSPNARPLLAELSYRCLKLKGGGQVQVGQAGVDQPDTVLLIHGLGNNAHRDWQPAIATLARQFRVVAVDLPGFGASPPLPEGYSFEALDDALVQTLAQLRISRAHVVGHSLGGAVSLYFTHRHPDLVERLVLVDAAGILLKPVFTQHLASVIIPATGIDAVDRLLKGVDQRIYDAGKIVLGNMEGRYDFSRWLAANPRVRNALLGRYTQIDAGLVLVEHDFTAAIRETRTPTTLIWGRNDPIAPLRTGELLAARLPDARLRVIAGSGHTPMSERPELFNADLLQALSPNLAPRASAPDLSGPARTVGCRDQVDAVFSGVFDELKLENCTQARITSAKLNRLVLVNSSVTIEQSVIEAGDGIAISAQRSQVRATALQLSGRVAIRTDNSWFDLAGVSLRASERGVEVVSPGLMYFSVSDWQAPEYTGDAHFAWPRQVGNP